MENMWRFWHLLIVVLTYLIIKKTFSVILLALVDAVYSFIAVDIGSYGKNSDGGIFATSNLEK